MVAGVKGSDLMQLFPNETDISKFAYYTVTITDEKETMPPEECISEKAIQAVAKAEEDVRQGRVTRFNSREEMHKHLSSLLEGEDE